MVPELELMFAVYAGRRFRLCPWFPSSHLVSLLLKRREVAPYFRSSGVARGADAAFDALASPSP